MHMPGVMQQVLLARPELSSSVGDLPEVPDSAQGLTTVLANMALLARNLNDEGIDANSLLTDSQSSDPGLTNLVGTLNGRRLMQVKDNLCLCIAQLLVACRLIWQNTFISSNMSSH